MKHLNFYSGVCEELVVWWTITRHVQKGKVYTYILLQEGRQVTEVKWIHSCKLHGEELQPQGSEIVQNSETASMMASIDLNRTAAYLDLSLQRLDVVYDFIKHKCLANHLNKTTFRPSLVSKFFFTVPVISNF